MKHYSWLTDDALSVVSLLFSLVEILSTLPPRVRVIQVALLMKPTGGFGAAAEGYAPSNRNSPTWDRSSQDRNLPLPATSHGARPYDQK
eukprot:8594828-Pyramimonas_sp.AAC.1